MKLKPRNETFDRPISVSAYGAFKNNITIVTLYTNLGNDGIAHAINETQVGALVCSFETWPKLKSVF
jgi:long-chain acyl-CoA synthetase